MSSSTTTSLVVNATSAEVNPSTYHHDINFDLSLVVFVIFLIALVWRLYCFIKHRNNDPLAPNHPSPSGGAEDSATNTDKKIRQSPEAIEKLLVFKTVVLQRRTGDENVLGQEEMERTMMNQSDLWLFLLDDDEEEDVEARNGRRQRTCAICLGDYEPGDQICGSKNPDCRHYFHSTCGMEWLAKHSQCPVCRADYLVEPEDCPADSKRNVNQEEQVPTRRMQTEESPRRMETSTVNYEASSDQTVV